MRARKPWRFLRTSREGWKVRFKGASPGSIAPMPDLRGHAHASAIPGLIGCGSGRSQSWQGFGTGLTRRKGAFFAAKSCRHAPNSANHSETLRFRPRVPVCKSEQCASAKLRLKRRPAARPATRHHNGAKARSARAGHLPS
jgi:hypothetical protein